MLKHILFFGALIIVVVFFVFGAATARSAEADPLVAVSIEPQRYAVDKITGGKVETVVLVPAGADPHTYEPKPSQVMRLAGASVYLSMGLEFEKAWLGRLGGINPDLPVIPMNTGLEIATAHHDEDATEVVYVGSEMSGKHGQEKPNSHDQDKHHHSGMDPHVWTSPAGMKRMAENALAALVRIDPGHAEEYRANAAVFQAEIDTLDAELRALFADVPESDRVFLVFHPAWGHFAEAYGLQQLSIETDGKEPGPVELARLIESARTHGVRAIFIQPQMSRRTAGSVAGAVGAQVVEADPMAPDWEQNLRRVARAFRLAMK